MAQNIPSASSRLKSWAAIQRNPGRLEKRAVRSLRQCKVLRLRRSNLPAGRAGPTGQRAASHGRTWRSWWTPNGAQVSGVPLLCYTWSCTGTSVGSGLTGVMISLSSTLMQLVLESDFEPASTRKTSNNSCECGGGPARRLVGWSTSRARRS